MSLPAPPARPVTARATGLPAPQRAPSGSHVPVPAGPSGAHRIVPVSGPNASARTGGALPVPRDMKRSGLQPVPQDIKRTGPQPVLQDMGRSGAQPQMIAPAPVPLRAGPTPARAWLWGVLLALLGGGLLLLAVLRQ